VDVPGVLIAPVPATIDNPTGLALNVPPAVPEKVTAWDDAKERQKILVPPL
jgi:hypothetical protein